MARVQHIISRQLMNFQRDLLNLLPFAPQVPFSLCGAAKNQKYLVLSYKINCSIYNRYLRECAFNKLRNIVLNITQGVQSVFNFHNPHVISHYVGQDGAGIRFFGVRNVGAQYFCRLQVSFRTRRRCKLKNCWRTHDHGQTMRDYWMILAGRIVTIKILSYNEALFLLNLLC